MVYKREDYRPRKKSGMILDAAWRYVQSVPYQVTARWLFYRLLQAGHYKTKGDYNNKFLCLLSRARHNFYQGWRPDTLADDARTAIVRGDGNLSVEEWMDDLRCGIACDLSHWPRQEQYVEIWFEANAMVSQFRHYTKGVTLRPFGGHPSIPFKWAIAKALEQAHEKYGLAIVILYFGDLDEHGLAIPEIAIEHIRDWCGVDFEVDRCGLNAGDETRYSIPENFEKPGTYQWEALDDAAAKALITTSTGRYVDTSVLTEIREEEGKVEDALEKVLVAFADTWGCD